MAEYCPICGFPKLGLCMNDDCRGLGLESPNARARRRARERAEAETKAATEAAARARAATEQKSRAQAAERSQAEANRAAAQSAKAGPKHGASSGRDSILLGRVVGVLGALLICGLVHQANPQNGAALFFIGPLAFAICHYFHLPILIGLLCAACTGGALGALTSASTNASANAALLAFLIGAFFHKPIARFVAVGTKVALYGVLAATICTGVFLTLFRTT